MTWFIPAEALRRSVECNWPSQTGNSSQNSDQCTLFAAAGERKEDLTRRVRGGLNGGSRQKLWGADKHRRA